MKRVIAALLVIAVVGGLALLQVCMAKGISDAVLNIANDITEEYRKSNKDGVLEKLDAAEKIWEENRTWVHMSMSTNRIDEIEISLAQARAYCEAEAWEDFAGEFVMFCKLVEHIEKQEAFSWGELL